jgi:cell division transport system ATP-binding protein
MIRFNKVSISFADQTTAIKELDLDIQAGDLWLITGPSGAGKTTLMKLLIGEYRPSSGEIHFQDQLVNKLKGNQIAKLRQQISVVFQDYKLIEDMNIWENIALPLYIAGKKDKEIAERVTDLLNLIGLPEKALYFPKQLSGGEAQRVSIARALASAPTVIFADEPTGNLDQAASLKITRLLKKINELGTTLLFATHDHSLFPEFKDAKKLELTKEPSKEAAPHKINITDASTTESKDEPDKDEASKDENTKDKKADNSTKNKPSKNKDSAKKDKS